MNRTLTSITTIGLFFATAVSPAAAESFKIAGSGGPQNLLRNAAAAFSRTIPGITVDVPDSIGTGGGFKAVGEGVAGMGRVTRPAKGKEAEYGLEYLPFARSPVVFHTHPGIKIKELTAAQTVDLFSGKIANWKEIGGPDQKVRIVTRQVGESNLDLIKKAIPGWKDMAVTENSKMANTDQEMSAAVADNPGAVGFGPMSEALDRNLNIPAIDGVPPSAPAYPALSDFALIFKKEKLTPGMKAFIDFLFSPEGGKIIKANAATPIARR